MSTREITDRLRFGRRLLRVLGWTVLVTLIVDAILIAIFRSRWQPAIDLIRRFNRRFLNPAMMRRAGKKNWYAGVVHHVGRTSGKEYATPIWPIPVGDFFYIPLPYGTEVDWCKNILAAGSCIIESRGVEYPTMAPTLVDSGEAAEVLPRRPRIRYAAYGVDTYLRLELAPKHIVAARAG